MNHTENLPAAEREEGIYCGTWLPSGAPSRFETVRLRQVPPVIAERVIACRNKADERQSTL